MSKNTSIAVIEVNRSKKGKLFIKTNLDAVPVDAVNEIINGVADRALSEAIARMSDAKIDDAVAATVRHFSRPWIITSVVEFVFILLLVLEKVL